MPLTGTELIAALKAAGPDMDHDERIRQAGYVFMRQGEERLNRQAFYRAVTEALEPGLARPKNLGRGRPLTSRASVSRGGHVVIGKAYLQQMGVTHGDRVAIDVGPDSLSLKKVI